MKQISDFLNERVVNENSLEVNTGARDRSMDVHGWISRNCVINGSYEMLPGNQVRVNGDLLLKEDCTDVPDYFRFEECIGTFNADGVRNLTTFEGFPIRCYEFIYHSGSVNNLKFGPVAEHYECANNLDLEYIGLEAEEVGDMDFSNCTNLRRWNAKIEIAHDVNCANCTKLVSIETAPHSINTFNLSNCERLKSTIGYINVNSIILTGCNVVRSLMGLNVHSNLEAINMRNLTDVNCAIDGNCNINLSGCSNLIELNCAMPERIASLNLSGCDKLVHLKGVARYIGGDLNLDNCIKLADFDEFPIYVGGNLFCRNSSELLYQHIDSKSRPIRVANRVRRKV